MKIAVDTNLLIYAQVASFAEHEPARRWVHRQLSEPDITLAVTPMILSELVHVITDPRRFEPPVAMSEALHLAGEWLGRSNVECLAMDEEAMARAFRFMDRLGLGRKRLGDTLLVGTLLTHGVTRLATHNRRDFEVFPQLQLIDPIEAA